ncbi:MAG: LysE family translocator [Akkermansiaceae bacterium]
MIEWFVFVGIMAVGQFSPGPDMLLLTRTALAQGRAAGCWTAFGIACGLGCHAAIAVAGVTSMLGQGGWLEMLLRYLAAAYLAWLAWKLVASSMQKTSVQWGQDYSALGQSPLSSWKRGLLCNLLNPKVAVFLVGVTAPFLVGKEGWMWPTVLWVTIVLEGVLLWCVWVCVLQIPGIKRRYQKAARWFDLAFGIALLGVAVALLIS